MLLVANEALHNAARHSGASRIEFGLAVDGRRWRLWVGDNGRGIASDGAASTTTHGLGLTSMRRRAGEIGAGLSISTAGSNGGGTVVSLVFDPLAEDRRLVD